MSGAEFSLACGVIQVIGFAFQLAEAYDHAKKGTSIDDALEFRAKKLTAASKALEKEMGHQGIVNDELSALAKDCFKTATKLGEEMKRILKAKGKSPLSKAFQAVKIIMNKTKIEKLKDDLKTHEAALVTGSLVHSMYV